MNTPNESDLSGAAGFLGWELVEGKPSTTNDNGSFELSLANEDNLDYLVLTGRGKAQNRQPFRPKITIRIQLPECTMRSTVENETP